MRALWTALLLPIAVRAQIPGLPTVPDLPNVPVLSTLQQNIPTLDGLIPAPDALQWTPMTQHDRLHFYLKSTFSIGTLAGAAAAAGVRMAAESPPEWNTEIEGYGQRLADNLAKSTIRLTLRYGVSAALKEDNRYIPSGKTSAPARLWYALSSTYAARDMQGHRRFSVSKFAGNGGGAAISRTWEPPSRQGGKRIALDFVIVSSVQATFNVAREFSTDIAKRLKH